jgi:hypothetical protein
LYFTNNFLPEIIFNQFRIAYVTKHSCIEGFGLLLEELIEFGPLHVEIMNAWLGHCTPSTKRRVRNRHARNSSQHLREETPARSPIIY